MERKQTMKLALALALLAFGAEKCVLAQQPGTQQKEVSPAFSYSTCTKESGCSEVTSSLVIDSNWRWTDVDGQNCYTGNEWNQTYCSGNDEASAQACAAQCAVEGADSQYDNTYGVKTDGNKLNLTYVTTHDDDYSTGTNSGSRMYLMDGDDKYKMFNLKNREFSVDVDYSNLGCGLNGAIYFVEMDADGGESKYSGNSAGAKYGTGYCDAQCPHDMKFINGEANLIDWAASGEGTGTGKYGTCCNEMDIFESNKMANSYTPHVCTVQGQYRCGESGTDCGDIDPNNPNSRYEGVCDKDGCDFAPYRLGDETFFGPGKDFTIDTSRPFTLVTKFITSDGTDDGDLTEIKRYFIQDGQKHQNPTITVGGKSFNSITDDFCDTEKTAFGDVNAFSQNGGLKEMGNALDRGMVLVMSLWDDGYANMLWLDSTYPQNGTAAGDLRGPCPTDSGDPDTMRQEVPNSNVAFSNVKVGEIGTTN
jgi:cellulose 1,4-beta-cellobiosidase